MPPYRGNNHRGNSTRGKKRSFSDRQDGQRPNPSSNGPELNDAQLSTVIKSEPDMAEGTTPAVSNLPRFDSLRDRLDATIVDTITQDMKFDCMTPVQAATINRLLQGVDVLAQAKTGTGKTVAFLVPSIERILRQGGANNNIGLLVISPTRELALQIATEAKKLLQRYPRFSVCTAIGGVDKNKEARAIYNGCQILVATPGRLLDHLSDEEMRFRLSNVTSLVLDEADRMLDMGFLPDIKKILYALPSKDKVPRQSMLFSATIPDSLGSVAKLILNDNYENVSTIPKGEANTHLHVPQYLIAVPTMIDLAPALVAAVQAEIVKSKHFKAIVFAPTAAHVDFYGHVLSNTHGMPSISLLHARISQPKRTKVTEEFRKATSGICIATDVIARGIDFPNVTHVLQCGLPMDRESYIHRLGRTARAEASGFGILILAEPEKRFTNLLKGIELKPYPTPIEVSVGNIQQQLTSYESPKKIYQAFLGYYKTFQKITSWTVEELVQQANRFVLEGLGAPEVPGLEKNIVGKMGLKAVKGLVVIPNAPGSGGGGGRRGGSGGGGRGGGGGGRGRGQPGGRR
ncbi:hypothetical protein E2P81_ATG07059 [Venturia nashicola]|uniref:ATP-dependent RNA helicase n=1 Tax=Venturia nashicola TaxID=86259 RepID=A0A4Z1NZ23_9PEZI|nr:hypothetical protein E6O75_ATG07224 [Venturia nashicola]TLD19442.1 hypothetical protein E2P81_ATG07059 [Venturia nashicola]